MKNQLVKISSLLALITAFATPIALADVGNDKLCVLGNTCEVKGMFGSKVIYHVKPSDGKDFVCYIKGKGKHHFEGKLKGKDGFKFSEHEIIAHKNPIRFVVLGTYTNKEGGSIVIQKQPISMFVRVLGNGLVTCDKWKD